MLSWALRISCSSVPEHSSLWLRNLHVPTARGTVRSGRNASALLGGVQESSSPALSGCLGLFSIGSKEHRVKKRDNFCMCKQERATAQVSRRYRALPSKAKL